MIESASTIPNDAILRCDICVVGSGAAGISLALRLVDSGLNVLVMEAGKETFDQSIQSIYEGEVSDPQMHPPAASFRQRRFGGSTGIWGGACIPFDAHDFGRHPNRSEAGWPIGISAVEPFYSDASEILEAGRFNYDARSVFGETSPPMIDGFESTCVTTTTLERFSCPTDLSVRYRSRLAGAERIKVLLDAACIAVELAQSGHSVRQLRFDCAGKTRFSVVAHDYVIATGGIENARLLLASDQVSPNGVGNARDQVGRHYMTHLASNIGEVTMFTPTHGVRHGYELSPEGTYCRRRITLTADEQARIGAFNMFARLHLPRITDPAHRNGVLSGLFLCRHLISYEYSRRLSGGPRASVRHYALHARNIIFDPMDTLGFLTHWIRYRILAARKFPSVVLPNRTNRFSLEVHAEQSPNPESRIRLSNKRDSLGMPQVLIDWRWQGADIESVALTLDRISDEFSTQGVGQFKYNRNELENELLRFGAYGGHHIGTTRMGSDPRDSVVDLNCQVHEVSNLFIAGSSVFRTSSQATPTLTIVALALRLADHLSQRGARRISTISPASFSSLDLDNKSHP